MTGDITAAADAVTGGVLARAVEPQRGESEGGGHGTCLNCGHSLHGAYCHGCGQSGHIHRTISAIGHELAHGVFHFEGKIWRTLPLLFFKPGQLTRRYIHGQRARFVTPLALFLFSVFLMVASFGAFGIPLSIDSNTVRNGVKLNTAQIAQQLAESKTKVKALEIERAAAIAKNESVEDIDENLVDMRSEVEALTLGTKVADGVDSKDFGDASKMIKADTGWKPLDDAVKNASSNPSLLLYKLQNSAYKFSWALIPISVPFVWLMFFWRRQYKVYDHAIFVTYSLSFMTLLLAILSVAGAVGLPTTQRALAITLLPPLHMYAQLRGAYQLGRFGAIFRTFLLLTFASIALSIFALLLLLLGVME
jgi:hypothetical protein